MPWWKSLLKRLLQGFQNHITVPSILWTPSHAWIWWGCKHVTVGVYICITRKSPQLSLSMGAACFPFYLVLNLANNWWSGLEVANSIIHRKTKNRHNQIGLKRSYIFSLRCNNHGPTAIKIWRQEHYWYKIKLDLSRWRSWGCASSGIMHIIFRWGCF